MGNLPGLGWLIWWGLVGIIVTALLALGGFAALVWWIVLHIQIV